MKYITHHRFKELALCGSQLNIPYGTELECVGETLITPEGKAVCYRRSESGKKHFARNDDGRGLERGRLTHALAYSNRKAGNGFRFSKEEAEILGRDWGTSCGLNTTLFCLMTASLKQSRRSCKGLLTF